MKKPTWLIMASMTKAFIYEVADSHKNETYKLIKEFSHEESRLKSAELGTDEAGHYNTAWSTRGQFAPHRDLHQEEQQHFAREVAQFLEEGKNANRYNAIILCAEPHFSGQFEKIMAPSVRSLIKKTIHKDYIPLPQAEFNQTIEEIACTY